MAGAPNSSCCCVVGIDGSVDLSTELPSGRNMDVFLLLCPSSNPGKPRGHKQAAHLRTSSSDQGDLKPPSGPVHSNRARGVKELAAQRGLCRNQLSSQDLFWLADIRFHVNCEMRFSGTETATGFLATEREVCGAEAALTGPTGPRGSCTVAIQPLIASLPISHL